MKLELELKDELVEGLSRIASECLIDREDVAKLALSSYVLSHKEPRKSSLFTELPPILIALATLLDKLLNKEEKEQ